MFRRKPDRKGWVLSDAFAVELDEGNQFDLYIDPTDPAVIVEIGGSSLSMSSAR